MKKRWRTLIGAVLLAMLVLVRQFEFELFYDPFMAFFSGSVPMGETASLGLYFNLLLRFLANSLISLGLLYCIFQDWGVLRFASFLFVVVMVVLFPFFIYLMQGVSFDNYLPVFYIRRFLAHPVLLLLLVPAFFYQRLNPSF